MFSKSLKSIVVRFVLLLLLLGGMSGVTGVQAAGKTAPDPVILTVQDTDGAPMPGLNVYAFNGATYTGLHGVTDQNGRLTLLLPLGSYRFRADLNSTKFWSGTSNHCDIPGCGSASVTVSKPVVVTVLDTEAMPKPGLNVYVFNSSTYTGFSRTTNAAGQAIFTLPLGSYRFRADLNGTQFWSGTVNHCTLPGCESAQVTVTIPITIMIRDEGGAPKSGVNVYAFNGSVYTGYSKVSSAEGQAVFTLPIGSYRFRADYLGIQYWSGSSSHCTLPGCVSTSITVGPAMTATFTPTAIPTDTPTATPTASPTAAFTPTLTSTPVFGCSSIRDSFVGVPNPLKFSGRIMYLDIPNPNPYPVMVRDIFAVWNYSSGGSLGRPLMLQSVQLNTTVFWTGNVSGPATTIGDDLHPFTQPVILPAGQNSQIRFTFDRTYTNPLGEEIVINFSTAGCELYPIIARNQ